MQPDLSAYSERLRWPVQLFVEECTYVLNASEADLSAARLLLIDAFGAQPDSDDGLGPWTVLKSLVDSAGEVFTESKPYWRERTGRDASQRRSRDWFARNLSLALQDLRRRGYFDEAMPPECPDGDRGPEVTPDEYLDGVMGVTGLWSLLVRTPDDLSDDMIYEVVEVLHDAASRPFQGWYHDWDKCGWHYGTFRSVVGRSLYRWVVNGLLELTDIPYRLADDGEDCGRLVAVTEDARDDFVGDVIGRAGSVSNRVTHAVSLFRARGATRDDRRSALKNLADELEKRRALLKTVLMSKDEGALFQIANEFDVRHHNARQQSDYDEAFLDWTFWWYLATIDLADRLAARSGAP